MLEASFRLCSLKIRKTITPALQASLGKMWGTNRVNYGKLKNRELVEISRAGARFSQAPETFRAREATF